MKKHTKPFQVGERVRVLYTGASSHWPNKKKIDFVREYSGKGCIVDAKDNAYLVELDKPSPWDGRTLFCAVAWQLRRLKKRERRRVWVPTPQLHDPTINFGHAWKFPPGGDDVTEFIEVKKNG